LKILLFFLVGRVLGTTSSINLDTPPSSPSLNRTETIIDAPPYQRKTSTGSSPSRTSSDDDSRHSNPPINSVTYVGGMTTRQPLSTNPRPSSTSLTGFKMMSISGNICPRCSKTVYLAEEVKAAGKVKLSIAFSSNMKSYFSHIINDVIRVLIVKEVSMLVVIQNTKEIFMIIVRF
jgi:hypothetical protein